MQIDEARWRALLDAYQDARDAAFAVTSTTSLQDAQARRMQARDQLERFKARGPQGHVSGPPHGRDPATGQMIIADSGGTTRESIQEMFERDVRELEARVAEAEREERRVAARSAECNARHNRLRGLVEDVRRWAAEQRPPVTLPGDTADVRGMLRDASAGREQPVGRVPAAARSSGYLALERRITP